jgi:hypothetical protein
MRRWVVILFVFLTLSNSSAAEEPLTKFLNQLSDSITKLSKEQNDKTLQDLMGTLQTRVSNTCQTPEGSCPLPSTAFKGTACSCDFGKRVFGTAQ